MTKLEDVEGACCRAYLKQINKKIQALELIINKGSRSQVSINSRLSQRLEILEKRGK